MAKAEAPFTECIEEVDNSGETNPYVISNQIQDCVRVHIKISFISTCFFSVTEFFYPTLALDPDNEEEQLERIREQEGFSAFLIAKAVSEGLSLVKEIEMESQARVAADQIIAILMKYDMWKFVDKEGMYKDIAQHAAMKSFLLKHGSCAYSLSHSRYTKSIFYH